VPGVLHGLRVIELATGVSGPYCGKLLAGLGADVLKFEPPGGDSTRRDGPFPGGAPDPDRSGLFLHLNTGKRGHLQPAGHSGLDPWLGDADVVIVAMQPADLAAADVDYAAWRSRFPALVIASVTPFGLTGPYADYGGGELVEYALGGYAMLTGSPDRQPLKAYGSLVEYQAGAHLALGVLAALRSREFSGQGQVVDCSAMEAATFMIGAVEQGAHFYGRVARRNGTRLLGFPPEHSYPSTIRPCRDGYVHCHSNNRYLDLLGVLIPNPRLADPEVLATMMGHADEVDAIMDEWLADKDRDAIVRAAQELRLPFTEVRTPAEVMRESHHVERGSFVTVDHPVAGPVVQPGAPIRMHGVPWVTGPAPALGQHEGESWRPREASVRAAVRPAGPKPLSGVRVIDFTNAVAGPTASSILADLGAEVVKVEGPASRPQHAAGVAPLLEGADAPSYNRVMFFNELNHGKRSVVLDVAAPRGREIFLELVRIADVVVQNFSPRVMGNLGISYETLAEVNGRIILTSMPAFGLSGPHRDRISYGPGIDAMSGLSHLTGYADGPPMKPGNFFCDQQAGVLAAFATLAALRHCDATGVGQHVELAMIEGEFQVLGDACIDVAMNGHERLRAGNAHPSFEPHDVFPCDGEDAWVAIAVQDEDQWLALCGAIDRADLAADPELASPGGRKAARDVIHAAIATWTRQRTHYAAQAVLQEAGVPAGAVLNALELLRDPHVTARHGFEYVDTPGVGPTPYPRVAFTLSETPVHVSGSAPGFGEANTYVLEGLLGIPAEDVVELERIGIVARQPRAAGGH